MSAHDAMADLLGALEEQNGTGDELLRVAYDVLQVREELLHTDEFLQEHKVLVYKIAMKILPAGEETQQIALALYRKDGGTEEPPP